MTKTGHAYLCTKGHVDMAPAMGSYATCQHPVQVVSRMGRYGHAPCGEPIVEVPDHDGVLEATFKIGGGQAVLDVIAARIRAGSGNADPATPNGQAR